MKEKVVIISVCSYSNAKGEGTRVGYIFADDSKKQKTDKFVGYAELSSYYSPDVFNKFTVDMIGVPVLGTFKFNTNSRNPMIQRQVLASFEFKGNVVNLI